jgi:hypothetical protein
MTAYDLNALRSPAPVEQTPSCSSRPGNELRIELKGNLAAMLRAAQNGEVARGRPLHASIVGCGGSQPSEFGVRLGGSVARVTHATAGSRSSCVSLADHRHASPARSAPGPSRFQRSSAAPPTEKRSGLRLVEVHIRRVLRPWSAPSPSIVARGSFSSRPGF